MGAADHRRDLEQGELGRGELLTGQSCAGLVAVGGVVGERRRKRRGYLKRVSGRLMTIVSRYRPITP